MNNYDKAHTSAPFLRPMQQSADIMQTVYRALCVLFGVSIILFGYAPIIIVGTAFLTAYAIVFLCLFFNKSFYFKSDTWKISILLFTLSLPPTTPWYVVIISTIVILALNQTLFKAGKNNIYNPALIGRAVAMVLFPHELFNKWAAPLPTLFKPMHQANLLIDPSTSIWKSLLDACAVIAGFQPFRCAPDITSGASESDSDSGASETDSDSGASESDDDYEVNEYNDDYEVNESTESLDIATDSVSGGSSDVTMAEAGADIPVMTIDAVTTPTPLYLLKNFSGTPVELPNYGSWELLAGVRGGAIGETSLIVLFVLGAILAIKKIIDIRISLIYVGTVVLLSYVFGGLVLKQGMFYAPLLSFSFTGSLVFVSIFYLTDYGTTPINIRGRFLMAFVMGVCVFFARFFKSYGDPQTFVLLIMNAFVGLFEIITRQPYFGAKTSKLSPKLDFTGDKVHCLIKAILGLFVITIAYIGFMITPMENFKTKQERTQNRLILDAFPNYIIQDKIAEDAYLVTDSDGMEAYLVFQTGNSYKGTATLAVVFRDGMVRALEILTPLSDTKGLGDQVYNEDWEQNLVGLSTDLLYSNLYPVSNIGIDAVAGATVSSVRITEIVRNAYTYLTDVLSNIQEGENNE